MFGWFKNNSIKRYATLMGALFNHIAVERTDVDGVSRLQKVPISFGGKERFIEKLDKINDSSDGATDIAKIETILPRMNLSLIDMMYNPLFKTNIANRDIRSGDSSSDKFSMQFNPVPYKFIFELAIFTRYEDDMFNIIEQILPYFGPNYTAKTTELHTNQVKVDRDIQVTIQSLIVDPDYGGDRFNRRRCEWSLLFELDGWLYPATHEQSGIIKTIYVDFFANTVRLDADSIFESADVMTCPDPEVSYQDWRGLAIIGLDSDCTPIPTGDEPSGVRGNQSGDCGAQDGN